MSHHMSSLLLTLVTLTAAAPGPRFIDDDYPRALAAAKKQKKLLFVDAWAPWCHSCVAMKEQVFTRPGFRAFERDVVFASIDTEKTKSATFLEKFPITVWPTLLFIDPEKEAVVLRWVGSADEAQMAALLTAARGGEGALREGDDAFGAGDASLAAEKYQAAVRAGAASDARARLSMLAALSTARQYEVCTRAVLEALPVLSTPQDRAVGVYYGVWCALESPPGQARTAALATLLPEARRALSEPALPDDVSGLYEVLVEEREKAGDDAGAKALAAEWLTFLDAEAAKATTPAARAVFDAHRVLAAIRSGQAQRLVAPLKQSEKALPRDYNPPARLALLYRELGQLDDAAAAIGRALARCTEGPRRLRLYETKASIQEKQGDAAAARVTREAALAYAKKLPRSQLSAQRLAALEAQLK